MNGIQSAHGAGQVYIEFKGVDVVRPSGMLYANHWFPKPSCLYKATQWQIACGFIEYQDTKQRH